MKIAKIIVLIFEKIFGLFGALFLLIWPVYLSIHLIDPNMLPPDKRFPIGKGWLFTGIILFIAIIIKVIKSGAFSEFLFDWRLPSDLEEKREIKLSAIPDLPCAFGQKMPFLVVKKKNRDKLIKALNINDLKEANWSTGLGAVYYMHYPQYSNAIFISPEVTDYVFAVGRGLDNFSPFIDNNFQNYPDGFKEDIYECLCDLDEVYIFDSYHVTGAYSWIWVKNGQIKRAFACSDGKIILEKGSITSEELQVGINELINNKECCDVFDESFFQVVEAWCLSPLKLEDFSQKTKPAVGLIGVVTPLTQSL